MVRPLFSIVCVLSQPLRDKRDNGTGGTSGTRDKAIAIGQAFSLHIGQAKLVLGLLKKRWDSWDNG
jgi:hypothetical protein